MSREEAESILTAFIKWACGKSSRSMCDIEIVKLVEAIEVLLKPKTGHWIKTGEEEGALGLIYDFIKCSHCGFEHSLLIPRNFCPNCGAKMVKSPDKAESEDKE